MAILIRFFQGKVRQLRCSGLLTSKGTLWNQSETMRSSTKPLGMSKTAENNQKDDFQRIQKSAKLLSMHNSSVSNYFSLKPNYFISYILKIGLFICDIHVRIILNE